MSLTRRLRRLIRAELGRLREEPFEDEAAGTQPDAETTTSADAPASSDAESTDVPSDVAEAYRALEVPVGSGREAVKKGYRRVMKKYHQDRFQNDPDKYEVAGEVSKRLNQAHDRVLDYLDAKAP
jgi:DnaJ-class molecular chaperone with C-terminal Zn finger domain